MCGLMSDLVICKFIKSMIVLAGTFKQHKTKPNQTKIISILLHRFWWEKKKVFTKKQRKQLSKASLSRVVCDNGIGIKKIQEDAFLALSDYVKRVKCKKLPRVNLKPWKEGGYYSKVLEIMQLKADRIFPDI